jgi:hypothetical protein
LLIVGILTAGIVYTCSTNTKESQIEPTETSSILETCSPSEEFTNGMRDEMERNGNINPKLLKEYTYKKFKEDRRFKSTRKVTESLDRDPLVYLTECDAAYIQGLIVVLPEPFSDHIWVVETELRNRLKVRD